MPLDVRKGLAFPAAHNEDSRLRLDSEA